SNCIVPLASGSSFLVGNPFTWQVQEAVKQILTRNDTPAFLLAEPAVIEKLLQPAAPAPATSRKMASIPELEARLKEEYVPIEVDTKDAGDSENSAPIIQLVNSLIEAAY